MIALRDWRLTQVLVERWPVITAVTLGCVLLVVGTLLFRGPVYTSSALVRVILSPSSDPAIASQVGSTGDEVAGRVLSTQREVVLSDSVVDEAAGALGMSADDVRDSVKVTPGRTSDTLSINGIARYASTAQEIAAAVTSAYLAASRDAGQRQLADAAAAMDKQLQVLKEQLKELPSSGADTAGQTQRDAVQSQYNALLQQQQGLLAQSAVYPGNTFLLNSATSPSSPSSMSLPVALVLGLGFGLVIGLTLAALLALRPTSIVLEDRLASGSSSRIAASSSVGTAVPTPGP